MNNGTVGLAVGFLLLWIAGLAAFVAFHPGGVIMSTGDPAANPSDVLKWLISEGEQGAHAVSSGASAAENWIAPSTH